MTGDESGPPVSFSVLNAAFNRRMDLAGWKTSDEFGKVAVPKGAGLIPLNFVIVDHDDIGGRRPVIGHVRSSKHFYEVIVPALDELGPLEVTCAVDGVLQRYADPVTGEDKGFGAHAADWANWILRDSVTGGPYPDDQPAQPWEGDGPDARLYRLAHNIVNYEVHDTDTTYFSTAAEVEAWLRRGLGNHSAPITVSVLDEVSLTGSAHGPALFEDHAFDRSESPELKAGYQANAFQPGDGANNWWDPDRRSHSRNPSLRTVMDGPALQAYTAANCLDYADLEPHLLPAGARANKNSWFVLRLGDTTCMAFPAQRTILTVSTDDDGATAEIAANEYFQWARQTGRERDFQKQWGRWLDENQHLTAEEIQAGLKALEQIIERSDDEPNDQ